MATVYRDGFTALPDAVRDAMCCPACHGELAFSGETWDCTGDGCGRRFPVVDGIPILLDDARSVFQVSEFLERQPTFFKPQGRFRRWMSAAIPSLSHNLATGRVLRQMHQRLAGLGRRPRVLVIGGGVVGVGMDALLSDPAIEVVESDVALTHRVRVVCDAHDLPFRDAAFDGVVCQAVLEHVVDPARCVEEIHRVLKLGGLLYADAPFICQVHGGAFDFTRFTRLGHRRLLRRFGELDSVISCGPAMALAWTLRYFFLSFVAHPRLRAVVSGLCRAAFFWLKYLDHLLVRRPAASDAAFAFYFLGEKREETLSDRELIRSFRNR